MEGRRERVSTVASPADLLLRAAAGSLDDPATRAWLAAGLRTWLRAGGQIDLPRALHLPPKPARLVRNYWLAEAARALLEDGEMQDVPGLLAREWTVFVSRGPWHSWRAEGRAPDSASRLRRALFEATRASNGRTLSARQLRNVVGNFHPRKFPQYGAMMCEWRLAPNSGDDNGNISG